ncbi:HEAT repeat domain-containing protein [Engelhardtia mirabilis]|uniref:VWFA domain-containing protein n=1 Tax=Engelhardtia mirabilis TaxID=2528011 RepID=A0A518BJ90_9BACT|nr:hypothetical protein Pla133_21020 [Planctomycetes bacterium Pla133]QDV01352.1 hypothetical protein Pla86_21020 [Planctomycetes bacterium Pla86]
MNWGRVLLAPLLICVVALSANADETVSDFKKLFKKFKERSERIEAVLALTGIDEPDVVGALAPVITDDDPEVARAAMDILAALRDPASVQAVVGALVGAKKAPEQIAWLRVLTASGQEPGEEGREALFDLVKERDWQVRFRALQTLTAVGGEGVVVALIKARGDDELAVRCAAIDGLAALKAPETVDQALAALAVPDWQERASAVAALGKVREKRSVTPLIERMALEEGRLRADIGATLEGLTGRGFGARLELWKSWWGAVEARFELPTVEELAAAEEARARDSAQYAPIEEVSYHGVSTPSRRILFVLDVSGSMDNLVTDRERFKAEDYRSWSRMDVVRRELQRAVEGLADYVEFNVVAFASEVDPWRSKPVKANVLQKRAAIDWLDGLETIGGNEDQDLAAVGLTGSANLEAGKTNSHLAMMYALGVMDERGRRLKADEYALEVDTIFFLSDGDPSVGEFVDPDDILREVREANELRKIVIHTFALGHFRKTFMERLAAESGGTFVDLGK